MWAYFFDDPFIEDEDNPYADVMQNKNFDHRDDEDGFLNLFLNLVEKHPEEYEEEFKEVFNNAFKDCSSEDPVF